MKTKSIQPYTFCKLKDGNYFLIVEVKNRRIEDGLLNDLICSGVLFPESKVNLSSDLLLITLNKINIRTASFKKINKFIFSNGLSDNEWIDLSDIEAFIDRKPISFNLPKDFEMKFI